MNYCYLNISIWLRKELTQINASRSQKMACIIMPVNYTYSKLYLIIQIPQYFRSVSNSGTSLKDNSILG